ncbi:MAG: ATP-binding cassette domain-containing protein [Pseudomonadota bacterium]
MILSTHDIVLECCGISHWFGAKQVLHNVNLKIIRGEIVSLVGPSGCGKSTLLRAIIGTHPPCQGEIIVKSYGKDKGALVCQPGRDRGIVYQRYSLFPFLTAQQNVAIGLMLDQTSMPYRLFCYAKWLKLKKQHLEEAADLLDKLKLNDAIMLYPHQMSGGMQQRVAVAQALIMKPEILLLDEPFGALDEATREELQRMLLTLYQENCQAIKKGEPPPASTILIVTHELNEAIYVGDRVVGLSQYWNWQAEGFSSCPGATIVYDRIAPIYQPDEEIDLELFAEQRLAIRQAAFDSSVLHSPQEFNRFWDEIELNRRGIDKSL